MSVYGLTCSSCVLSLNNLLKRLTWHRLKSLPLSTHATALYVLMNKGMNNFLSRPFLDNGLSTPKQVIDIFFDSFPIFTPNDVAEIFACSEISIKF